MKNYIRKSIAAVATMILVALPIQAQDNARINYIRKVYKEAVANADKNADTKLTVTQRAKADKGIDVTTLDFFYLIEIIEGPDIPFCKLNLLRRTSKGSGNSYEEFLYDPEDESLLFYFTSFEQEKGIKCETRWYANGNGDGTSYQVSKYTDTKTGKDVSERYKDYIGMPWDEGFLNRFARDMQEAFNHLTLRGWD